MYDLSHLQISELKKMQDELESDFSEKSNGMYESVLDEIDRSNSYNEFMLDAYVGLMEHYQEFINLL